jgi:hypothetical protein
MFRFITKHTNLSGCYKKVSNNRQRLFSNKHNPPFCVFDHIVFGTGLVILGSTGLLVYMDYKNSKNPDYTFQHFKHNRIRNSYYGSQQISYYNNDVQLEIVKMYGDVFKYIEKPSLDIQNAAVTRDYREIRHIRKPSEQTQLIALKKSKNAIAYIEKPSKKAQLISDFLNSQQE